MFVTEIRPLNKKKSRILFDDGEDLVLYNGEIRASRIKEQEELPDEVYEKLAGEVLTKRAKHRAMYLLLGQMRTKKELEDKLRKDGYPERAIEEAVSYVESFHYIDDRAYVEQYLAGSGAKKGKKAVLYALAQKGVDRELVESVLEEQEDARDEYELAKSAAFAKLGTPHRLDEKEYRRAAGFLEARFDLFRGDGAAARRLGHCAGDGHAVAVRIFCRQGHRLTGADGAF